jgi:hypothetical protein
MSYSDFKTLDQVNKDLGIVIKGDNELYINVEPVELTPWFIETMKMAYIKAIRINTENSRQALIVDHVLMELNQHVNMSFFLENSFNVDSSKGLTGNPDGIISSSDNQLYITSPVVVLVEAKKSDLGSGSAQCIAEMEAARIFNEKEGNNIPTMYGVVTDGALWQFLSLKDNIATIDSYLYHFGDGSQIVGILKSFIDNNNE